MQTIVAVALLGLMMVGCVSVPRAPNVMVYVGHGKTFEQYQYDAAYCRSYAEQQLASGSQNPTGEQAVTGAALLGLLGAGLGAGIGAIAGSPATGAAIGGATGVVTGGVGGMHRGDAAAMTLQGRYDQAYAVCMDAYQHRVTPPLMGFR